MNKIIHSHNFIRFAEKSNTLMMIIAIIEIVGLSILVNCFKLIR